MKTHHENTVEKAFLAWEGAPLHVKTMAGNYMRPVLDALFALSQQAIQQAAQIEALRKGPNGNHS